MKPEDVVTLMIPATYLVMLAIERLRPARAWTEVRFWRSTGVAFFVMVMTVNALLPSLVPSSILAHRLLDGTSLGVAGGAVVGYLCVSFANAAVHRAYHRYDVLWRFVHQLHHSPPRVDISGAVYFAPLEVAINVLVFLFVTVLVLGLDPVAAAVCGYIAVFYGLFQHLNVSTPRWLGVLIQRPESHGVHHRRGVHAYNYSDLPVWDMLWGTFRNPQRYRGEAGFEKESSRRIGAMLIGRDVNAEVYGARSRGAAKPMENPA